MKKLIIVLGIFALLITSCKNTKYEKYILGNWEQHTIKINLNDGDTLYHFIRNVNFTDSGYVFINKYNQTDTYLINWDSISFFSTGFLKDEWVINWKNTHFINRINDSLFTLINENFNGSFIDTTFTQSIIHMDSIYHKNFSCDYIDSVYIEEFDKIFRYYKNDTIISKYEFFYKRIMQEKPELYDKVFFNLAQLYGEDIPIVIPNDKEILGNGQIFITFNIKGNSYFIEPKIKGCIDKTFGILPKNETIGKYSRWERAMMNVYEWETLDMKLLMETYHKTYSWNDKDYLEIKMWITLK